jgi:ATP-binding cassette subfamily F protein 3
MGQESQRFLIIAGKANRQRKHICAERGCGGLLPQHLLATDGATVMEEASKAFGEILE